MEKDEVLPFMLRKYGKGKHASYIIIDEVERKIWLDARAFPASTLLCAMCDAITITQHKYKGKLITFFPIDWLLEKWGGSEEYLVHVRKVNENISNEMGWSVSVNSGQSP